MLLFRPECKGRAGRAELADQEALKEGEVPSPWVPADHAPLKPGGDSAAEETLAAGLELEDVDAAVEKAAKEQGDPAARPGCREAFPAQ